MAPVGLPDGIDENIIDVDGTMVETWRLHGDPKRIEELRAVPGVDVFMRLNPQVNTLLSRTKSTERYQLDKVRRFGLLDRFEQTNGGGGMYVCDEDEQKKGHLENLVKRFFVMHPQGDLRRVAVIGNNCKCELKFGIELGVTVVRMRQKEDPHAEDDLPGPHHEVTDWFGVMRLPFFEPHFRQALARRA